MYGAMGRERYVLRRLAARKIQTFVFDGDTFHPAQSQREGPVFLELVQNGVSQIERFDLKTYSLNPALGTGPNSTEPALSPDEGKLAFVADGGLGPGLSVDCFCVGFEPRRGIAGSLSRPGH
jgi:hypothetical protein